MAASLGEAQRSRLAAAGVRPLSSEVALAALGRLMRGPRAHVMVAAMDWEKVAARAGGDNALGFLTHLLEPPAPGSQPATSRLMEQVRLAPPAAQRALMVDYVRSRVATILGAQAEEIGPTRRFFNLGVDSLMAVEIKNLLERELALPLQPTLLFDHPTSDALAEHLTRLLGLSADASPTPHAPPEPAPVIDLASVRGLSDDAVDALFSQMGGEEVVSP